jgi:tetratricopeptide (TPR) repeat protein
LFFAISGNAQNTEVKSNNCNCNSKAVQDSLVKKYLDNGAHKYWYTTPQWQLYCDSLIAICPNIAVAYQNKAIPFIKYGEYEIAFALEDKAVELDPRNYMAYRAFLKCIFTKDYEGAIIDFDKAQQLVPNSYEMDHTYFFYKGLCNLELGNYSEAEDNLKKDIFIQTGGDTLKMVHFNSLYYFGVIYYEMKNYRLAKINLLKCMGFYPEHPQANFYMAQIYRAEGDTILEHQYLSVAKKALEKGLEINEDNLYYSNYPHQVRLYEVERALSGRK